MGGTALPPNSKNTRLGSHQGATGTLMAALSNLLVFCQGTLGFEEVVIRPDAYRFLFPCAIKKTGKESGC
jgi:hypothetical protein